MSGTRKKKNKELSVLKIREILRLRLCEGRSYAEIAASCRLSKGAVSKYLNRAVEAGINATQLNELDEDGVRTLLSHKNAPKSIRPMPDFAGIHQELQKKNVTLSLLWEEYKHEHPHGYQYSQFCEHYRTWRRHLKCSMRQVHKAGEKMFVDYAGSTVPIYDRPTGKVVFNASIFVACLGASHYTFAEASPDQSLKSWINSHVRCFEFFKGVPQIAVVDNLKSGVSKACRYEPDLNPTYAEMAAHYGITVLPARVRKPQDKSKVESSVGIVGRWILARLRKRRFLSLAELNRAIAELLVDLNERSFQKIPGSRKSRYEDVDRPALSSLPKDPYRLHYWKQVRVHVDYHVEVEKCYYSVPYQFIGQKLDARYTDRIVEIFSKNKRIASHTRSHMIGGCITTDSHMPAHHREYKNWSPERFMNWARKIGPAAEQGVHGLLHSRRHVYQSYRSCLGILNLSKTYSNAQLEAACARDLEINAFSYKSIKSILKNNLIERPAVAEKPAPDIRHKNIRGENYFCANHQPTPIKEAVSCLLTQLKTNFVNSNSTACSPH